MSSRERGVTGLRRVLARSLGRCGVVVWMGCQDVLGECPEPEQGFAPSLGPEACNRVEPDVARTSMECTGGQGFEFDEHVLVLCNPDVCAEGFECPPDEWYCVEKTELESWGEQSCPRCDIHCDVGEFGFGNAESCAIRCDPEK